MTTDSYSLQQAVEQALLPIKFLGWLEKLPAETLSEYEEGIDLLLKYLQEQVRNLGDVILEPDRLWLSQNEEVSYPRWLRWFLLDYDETHKPLPGWKPRYLLLKAIADDLCVRHQNEL